VRGRLGGFAEAWPRIAAALLGFSVLATMGFADGGVLPRAWRLATLALCAIAAAALLARARIALARLEWAVVAALAAFTGWIALSAAWSGRPTVSILQAERTVVYVALVLAVLLVAEREVVPHLLGGMVAGITVVAGFGLAEYLVSPPPLDPFEGSLLHRPLGYANALGIFAAIGALLCAGLALAQRRRAARAAALAPLVVLLPALYLTSSRGAWIALAAGLVLLVRFGRPTGLPVVAGLAGLALAAVAAVLVVSGGPVPLENRGDYWQAAWQQYVANPLVGDGAGTFGEYWLAQHGRAAFTRTAHSLYLQSLAELGPVGLLLVLAALGLPLVRLRARGDPLVAAAGAAYVAYVLHTGIDWDWEMPAVTAAGLLSGAAVLVATRSSSEDEMRFATRAALLVPLLALAVVAALRIGTGPSAPFGP
jgi:O-antigen ligase